MFRISNLKIKIKNDTAEGIKNAICRKTGVRENEIRSFKIVKKAIDARKKQEVHYVLTVDADLSVKPKGVLETPQEKYILPAKKKVEIRPVICGTGPAGLFAGLILARCGQRPVLLERGEEVDKRVQSVERFWKDRVFNKESNVQFGEGGAGTFSDGKLTSGIKDIRCTFILTEFIRHGAPEEIAYLSKPHIGTDRLRQVVKSIRNEIISLGGEFLFNTRLSDLIVKDNQLKEAVIETNGRTESFPCSSLILAIGHSSRDTFAMLAKNKIQMAQKPFAVGVRIEHLQSWLNETQFGEFADILPPADYKLFVHLPNGRTVYTFCMCPGGLVVGAASEENSVVVNGMSNYRRDGANCNSALLCEVRPEDFGSSDPLAGIYFQQKIERTAYTLGGSNYNAPASLLADFMKNSISQKYGEIIPSYAPGITFANLSQCLPDFIIDSIKESIPYLERKLPGFSNPNAVLTGVETRSSSPVRLLRDHTLQSNIRGIYPCGEGAGYAGGIMSAAVDGIKCAEFVLKD